MLIVLEGYEKQRKGIKNNTKTVTSRVSISTAF
jgi:hypothetical protein